MANRGCTNPEHIERYKDGRCKECQRAGRRKHYYSNKQQYFDRARQREADMLEYIRKLKEEAPCIDCGINYPYYVMDFHHLGDKSSVVSGMHKIGSWNKLLTEIEKCVIICSNCHRERTWQESNGEETSLLVS